MAGEQRLLHKPFSLATLVEEIRVAMSHRE